MTRHFIDFHFLIYYWTIFYFYTKSSSLTQLLLKRGENAGFYGM